MIISTFCQNYASLDRMRPDAVTAGGLTALLLSAFFAGTQR